MSIESQKVEELVIIADSLQGLVKAVSPIESKLEEIDDSLQAILKALYLIENAIREH